MLSFNDFVVRDLMPGEDEYSAYRAQKRHRGVIGEGKDDPCWDDYKQVGMKKKDGKEVPNCVPEEKELDEALTTQQRVKRKALIRRLKAKLKIGRQRAAKKRADPERIKKRAEKRARMSMFKKLSGGKGKSDMSFAQRQSVENRLAKKKSAIARIARKLLPTVRKDDMAKMVNTGK